MAWHIGDNSITKIKERGLQHYVELSFNAVKPDEFDVPIRLVLTPVSQLHDRLLFKTPLRTKISYGTPKVFFYDKPQDVEVVPKEDWQGRLGKDHVGKDGLWPPTWPKSFKSLNPEYFRDVHLFEVTRELEGLTVYIWIPPDVQADIGVGIFVKQNAHTDWLPMYSFRKIWPRKPLIKEQDFELVWTYILDNSASGAAGEMTLELSVQTMVQQAMARVEQQTFTTSYETTAGFKVPLGGGVELSGSGKMSTAIATMKQLQLTNTTSFQQCQKVTLKAGKKEIGKYCLKLPFEKGVMQALQCTTLELSEEEKARSSLQQPESQIGSTSSSTAAAN